MRLLTVLLFTIVLFSSCSKLPIYKSEILNSETESEFPEMTTNKFNKTNNVHYGIANSTTNLYVKAIFHDQQSLMKIMRGGLSLYFDPLGKKGKDYQLKIERNEQQAMQRPAMSQQKNTSRENRFANMPAAINKTFTKVTWNANGEEFIFYRGLQKQAIDVELRSNEFNELVLFVKMPLAELPTPNNNLLSMGIETGSASSASNKSTSGGMRPSGSMGGRGMSGGGGGGMGGGMGSGGMGRGMSGGPSGGTPRGSSSTSNSTLKIWVQVEL